MISGRPFLSRPLCSTAGLVRHPIPGCPLIYWHFLVTWLFQTWLLAILTRKHSFALFCAHLRSFAHICVFLRPTAFRTTAFANCRLIEEGATSLFGGTRGKSLFYAEQMDTEGFWSQTAANHPLATVVL